MKHCNANANFKLQKLCFVFSALVILYKQISYRKQIAHQHPCQ